VLDKPGPAEQLLNSVGADLGILVFEAAEGISFGELDFESIRFSWLRFACCKLYDETPLHTTNVSIPLW
jgi:hypothetical protein